MGRLRQQRARFYWRWFSASVARSASDARFYPVQRAKKLTELLRHGLRHHVLVKRTKMLSQAPVRIVRFSPIDKKTFVC